MRGSLGHFRERNAWFSLFSIVISRVDVMRDELLYPSIPLDSVFFYPGIARIVHWNGSDLEFAIVGCSITGLVIPHPKISQLRPFPHTQRTVGAPDFKQISHRLSRFAVLSRPL